VTSTTRPQARDVFAVIDAMDVATLGSLFAEDGRVTFANSAPLVGVEEIRTGTTLFFETIAGLHHTIVNEWNVDGETIVELKVTYDRKDGQQVTIPCVTIFDSDDDGKIDDYRVYFDVAPIYA
jgi:ketosteroid isomerase-like protein